MEKGKISKGGQVEMTENKVSFSRWLWDETRKIVPIRRWLFDPATELGLFAPVVMIGGGVAGNAIHWAYAFLVILGVPLLLHAVYRFDQASKGG